MDRTISDRTSLIHHHDDDESSGLTQQLTSTHRRSYHGDPCGRTLFPASCIYFPRIVPFSLTQAIIRFGTSLPGLRKHDYIITSGASALTMMTRLNNWSDPP